MMQAAKCGLRRLCWIDIRDVSISKNAKKKTPPTDEHTFGEVRLETLTEGKCASKSYARRTLMTLKVKFYVHYAYRVSSLKII